MARILVVDDEPKIRELIGKYASFAGHEVVQAASGLEAVERSRQETFDLLIMDVMMPELDGFSAVKEIRKEQDVPVLMLSARGEEYDRIHGFEVGADDYVVKPFSPKELMMRVDDCANRAVHPLCRLRADECFPGFVFIDDKMPAARCGQHHFQHPGKKRLLLAEGFYFSTG